jgi:hypothetical protein
MSSRRSRRRTDEDEGGVIWRSGGAATRAARRTPEAAAPGAASRIATCQRTNVATALKDLREGPCIGPSRWRWRAFCWEASQQAPIARTPGTRTHIARQPTPGRSQRRRKNPPWQSTLGTRTPSVIPSNMAKMDASVHRGSRARAGHNSRQSRRRMGANRGPANGEARQAGPHVKCISCWCLLVLGRRSQSPPGEFDGSYQPNVGVFAAISLSSTPRKYLGADPRIEVQKIMHVNPWTSL